ncbi:uncharacterized protein F5147DRAFT_773094 [Suillus discolor]|uniref:Uncharacterized protein n=1 Tax=Suillus discolor TaxID=1912936 RepID=A0A9P7F710_9AGAM|nr:uncharacterized protein F5147DRAFT_773094 [Suillus discolor]KAG2109279.1 hypothetical protein F5147DRAFT_773094 [Suillus discolor]
MTDAISLDLLQVTYFLVTQTSTIEEQPSMKDPPANLTILRDVGQKRRLAEGANGEPSTSGPHETRTTQPPPERFKKEKGSIFISKKNKSGEP